MWLTELAAVARRTGLPVVEVDGWQTRGHSPPLVDIRTVVCHHTAGPAAGNMPSLHVIRDGRPGLDGPLANLGLARDGTVYVVAAGKAWHAGQVRHPSFANEYSIGVEAEATGLDVWPAAQMEAYARLCAALVLAYELTPARVLGHKEVCYPHGRKSDPNFAMDPFRARVAEAVHTLTQETDMPLTPDEIGAIAAGVWRYAVTAPWDGKPRGAATLLASTHYYTLDAAAGGRVPDTAVTNPGAVTSRQLLTDQIQALATRVEAFSAAALTQAQVDGVVRAALVGAGGGLSEAQARAIVDAVLVELGRALAGEVAGGGGG